MKQIAAFLALLGRYRWGILASVCLGVLSALAEGVGVSLFIPLLQSLFDDAPPGSAGSWLVESLAGFLREVPTERRVATLTGAIFGLVLVRSLVSYGNAVLSHWLESRCGHRLRSGLFERLLRVEYGFIERSPSGRLLHILSTQTWRTTEALDVLIRTLVTASTIAVYLVLLLLLSWKLTLLVGLVMLTVSLAMRFVVRRARRLGVHANRENAALAERMLDGVEGMAVIRAFGREAEEQRRFAGTSHAVSKAFERIGRTNAAQAAVHQVLAGALLVAVLLAALPEPAAAAPVLVFMFVLYRLQPLASSFEQGRLHLASLMPAVGDVADVLRAETQRASSGSLPFGRLREGIVFEDVTFSYEPSEAAAIESASFTIPARATTALVGRSGAGKSTLVKLLMRFHDPSRGEIRVDGTPLSDLDLATWRAGIAVVPQECFLFNRSALENIRYGRPDASEQEVVAAAMQADADEFIRGLPDGYHTLLGDRGTRLSGGQRQRIALARALIREPEIVILDEATNAIDCLSEEAIHKALDSLERRPTLLVIAHRLVAMERSDHVVVLERGRVVEQGSPRALRKLDGLFMRLYPSLDAAGEPE